MTTKLIGIKKFRENISQIWKEAQKKEVQYIILYHSKPVFTLNPIREEDMVFQKLAQEIKEAREEVRRGEIYSEEEIYKALGV